MQLSMAGIHTDFAHDKRPSHKAVGVSRKDTIIIAMLVNIALLAVLFATASRTSQNSSTSQIIAIPKVEPVVARFETISQVSKPIAQVKEPVDEIDEILKSYAQKTIKPAVVEVKSVPEVIKETVLPRSLTGNNYLEVKVKKGDVLSRIAKQHNVKVEELIILNGLDSAKLKIGQVLKVPKAQSSPQTMAEMYVVQDGDSPWKIAKKCRIQVEDLLRLNNLDEEKAKNLKIGQKLRIRS